MQKEGAKLTKEQLDSVEHWLEHKLQQGYTIRGISKYLSHYGYSKQHILEVLSYHQSHKKHEEFHKQTAEMQMPTGAQQDSESLKKVIPGDIAPKMPTEFFSRYYAMLTHPSLFFSHLYMSKRIRGFRMLSFSILLSLSLGLLYWFAFYVFNAFLYIPSTISIVFSISFTVQTFLLFLLVFVLVQPIYYYFEHKHDKKTTFKQSLSGALYAIVPFVTFAWIPLINLVGLLTSVQLMSVAMKKQLHADDRTIFYAGTIYAIAITLIALAMSLIVASIPDDPAPTCTIFPEGSCSVMQTKWNELIIDGIPPFGITVYDEDDGEVCEFTDRQIIECNALLLPGAYYFASTNITGAFVIE